MIPQEFYAHSQSRISLFSSVLSGEGCVCSGRDDNICLTHKYHLYSFCVNGCKWNGVACFPSPKGVEIGEAYSDIL